MYHKLGDSVKALDLKLIKHERCINIQIVFLCFLNSYNERLDEKIKRQIGMTVGKTRETSTTIGMSENNQQIRKKTNRTFIVRYHGVPPPLFITETPNLLGRLFISFFFFSTRQTKSRYDRLVQPVSGGANEKRISSNRAIE